MAKVVQINRGDSKIKNVHLKEVQFGRRAVVGYSRFLKLRKISYLNLNHTYLIERYNEI